MSVLQGADARSAGLGFAYFFGQDSESRDSGATMAREAVEGGGGTPLHLVSEDQLSSDTYQRDSFIRSSGYYEQAGLSVVSITANDSYQVTGRLQSQLMQLSTAQVEAENVRASALAASYSSISFLAQSVSVETTADAADASAATESAAVTTDSEEQSVQTTSNLASLVAANLQLNFSAALAQINSASKSTSDEDLAGLRDELYTNLYDFFDGDESKVQKYGKLFDDLRDIDPELYEKAVVLMNFIGKNNTDEFLDGLSFFKKSITELQSGGSLSQPVSVDSAEITGGTNFSQEIAGFSLQFNAVEAEGKIKFSFDFAQTEEGQEATSAQAVSLSIQQQLQILVETGGVFKDPLVLDMNGDGINLKSAEDGVAFDLDGDSKLDNTAFVQGDDALLFLDKNDNGVADNGLELFGDQEGDAHGFAKLAKYDDNGDGVIDAKDDVYSVLKIWQDYNGDGVNQAEESRSLLEAGIAAIELAFENIYEEDDKGNIQAQAGSFLRSDGSRSRAVDVLLRQAN